MQDQLAHDVNEKSRTEDIQILQDVCFPSLLLPDFILRGLENAGFKKPSPIQLAAIPLARCGLDLIVQAKSGTGKTLVFAITALESLKVKLKRLQVVILAPTREIAIQNGHVIKSVGHFLKGMKIGSFIGGMPMLVDKQTLSGCHIAVGAPGRIRHLIEEGYMDSSAVRLLVLDEADKLISQDEVYLNDINYIFHKCCSSKQTLACSATYTPELLEFVKRYMRSGRHVIPDGSAVPVLLGLRQFVYITEDHRNNYARLNYKQDALFNLLNTIRFDQALVFTNYITRAESLCSMLNNKGWVAASLTGKQSQQTRNETVERLKEHKARVVVATDLASRGLDASSINLVINFDIPLSGATYLHRIGRAGRFGSQGICITLVCKGQECRRFCYLLGEIGGSSMSVNVVPKNVAADLWTVEMDDLKKVYGIIPPNEEEVSPNEQLNVNVTESSAISDTGSVNGTSPGNSRNDSSGLFNKEETIRKTVKIGHRDRKFSNSLREQVERAESSDYEDNIKDKILVESKQVLSFPCRDTSYDKSSSNSKSSYQSSDIDDYVDIDDEISSFSSSSSGHNATSSDESKIDKSMNNLTLSDRRPNNLPSYSSNTHHPSSYNQLHNYPSNNYISVQPDDWHIRIEIQIQNYVQYCHNFQPC